MSPPRRLDPTARFQRRSDVLDRACLDGFVLYDPAGERIHLLNEAARFVWQRCEAGTTLAEIVAEASGSADLPLETAAAHVRDALRLLLDRGLLHEA